MKVSSIIVLAMLVCAATIQAEEAADTVAVEVTGRNVNLVKALCGEDAPETDATFGALNALQVMEVVDAEGNAVEGFAGKIVHYLPVAAAADLIGGDENVDKDVTVKGVLYKNALTLAVAEFEITVAVQTEDGDAGDDDWDDWDDWDELGVTTMSQQQVI